MGNLYFDDQENDEFEKENEEGTAEIIRPSKKPSEFGKRKQIPEKMQKQNNEAKKEKIPFTNEIEAMNHFFSSKMIGNGPKIFGWHHFPMQIL